MVKELCKEYYFIKDFKEAFGKMVDILPFVKIQMNLEDNMLGEIIHDRRTNTTSSHLYEIMKLMEAESRLVVARAWGLGSAIGRCGSKSTKFPLCKMIKSWRTTVQQSAGS